MAWHVDAQFVLAVRREVREVEITELVRREPMRPVGGLVARGRRRQFFAAPLPLSATCLALLGLRIRRLGRLVPLAQTTTAANPILAMDLDATTKKAVRVCVT
ncbi:MAG: hypothetical protein ABIP94_20725 [Planctomycetota bacterium]